MEKAITIIKQSSHKLYSHNRFFSEVVYPSFTKLKSKKEFDERYEKLLIYPHAHHFVQYTDVIVLEQDNLQSYFSKQLDQFGEPNFKPFLGIYLARIIEHNTIEEARKLFFFMKQLYKYAYVLVPNMLHIATYLNDLDPNTWTFERLNLDIFNEFDPNDSYSTHKWFTTFNSVTKIAKSEDWNVVAWCNVEIDVPNSQHILFLFESTVL